MIVLKIPKKQMKKKKNLNMKEKFYPYRFCIKIISKYYSAYANAF